MNKGRAAPYDVVILGGGWAGLLVAREYLKTRPESRVLVLEKSDEAHSGGLLRSESVRGFTFDVGGPHILFSRHPEILDDYRRILRTNFVELPRRNFVLFDDKFVPYPFENGIYRLSPATRSRIGSGLIEAAMARAREPLWRPATFRDWIYGVFGNSMAQEYLEPYNSKIWKRPLDSLSADWTFTPGRVPLPSLDDLCRAIAGLRSVGYKEQSRFLYPKRGGIEALYRAVLSLVKAAGAQVKFGTPVKSVKRWRKGWLVNESFSGQRLISTIPLPSLVRMIRRASPLEYAAQRFDYNQVLVVGVALKGPDLGQTAIFVPSSDIIFHRYTWMSYMSPPDNGGSNLIAEVTIPAHQTPDLDQLCRRVRKDLAKLGVVKSPGDILLTRCWLNEFGYPIYTRNHQAVKRQTLGALKRLGIYSVGRWGSWEYWNTDMVALAVQKTVSDMFDEEATAGRGHSVS